MERTSLPEIRKWLDQCPWIILRLQDDSDVEEDALNAVAEEGGAGFYRCSAFTTGRGATEAIDAAVRASAEELERNSALRRCAIM